LGGRANRRFSQQFRREKTRNSNKLNVDREIRIRARRKVVKRVPGRSEAEAEMVYTGHRKGDYRVSRKLSVNLTIVR